MAAQAQPVVDPTWAKTSCTKKCLTFAAGSPGTNICKNGRPILIPNQVRGVGFLGQSVGNSYDVSVNPTKTPTKNPAINRTTYFSVFSPLTPPKPTKLYSPAPPPAAAESLAQKWNVLLCGFIRAKTTAKAHSHSPGEIWSVDQGFCSELHTGLSIISQVLLISYFPTPKPSPSTNFIVVPIDESTGTFSPSIVFHISVDRLKRKAGCLGLADFENIVNALKF